MQTRFLLPRERRVPTRPTRFWHALSTTPDDVGDVDSVLFPRCRRSRLQFPARQSHPASTLSLSSPPPSRMSSSTSYVSSSSFMSHQFTRIQIVVYFVVILALWNLPGARVVINPLKLMTIGWHELCHITAVRSTTSLLHSAGAHRSYRLFPSIGNIHGRDSSKCNNRSESRRVYSSRGRRTNSYSRSRLRWFNFVWRWIRSCRIRHARRKGRQLLLWNWTASTPHPCPGKVVRQLTVYHVESRSSHVISQDDITDAMLRRIACRILVHCPCVRRGRNTCFALRSVFLGRQPLRWYCLFVGIMKYVDQPLRSPSWISRLNPVYFMLSVRNAPNCCPPILKLFSLRRGPS